MRESLRQVSPGPCVMIAVSGNIIRTGLRVRERGDGPLGKVFISDLVVRGIIGVNAWERETPQDFVINLVLFTDLTPQGETDDIADCLDYQDDRREGHGPRRECPAVHRRGPRRRRGADRPGVSGGATCPGPGREAGAVASCRSVGVEIERDRPGAD